MNEASLTGGSVPWDAAPHGGAVKIRIERVELALVHILDIRNIVAKSVFPRLSGRK